MKQGYAWYNEVDPKAAEWLRNLIFYDLIAPGDVDTRSIEDVTPGDLKGYTQCHFFAGIGVWSYAFRLAGWSDRRSTWSGSCPCQPFSAAGKGGGAADERHLWPAWYHLIQHGKPAGVPIFGEQVASPAALAWLDLVSADMEDENHAVWPVDLCAASAGAPHIRQRLFWVADDDDAGRFEHAQRDGEQIAGCQAPALGDYPGGCGGHGGMAEPDDAERRADAASGNLGHRADAGRPQGAGDAQGRGGDGGDASRLEPGRLCDAGGMAHRAGDGRREERPHVRGLDARDRAQGRAAGSESGGVLGGRLADSDGGNARAEREQRGGEYGQLETGGGLGDGMADSSSTRLEVLGEQQARGQRPAAERGGAPSLLGNASSGRNSGTLPRAQGGAERRVRSIFDLSEAASPYDNVQWIYCRDNKWRPVEPGSFPLAHGAPARVGRLRGYGNAIQAQIAAEFIKAYMTLRSIK